MAVGVALLILDLVVYSVAPESKALLLTISVLLTAAAALFSFWYSGRLVRPLMDLVPQADAIEAGRLEVSNHGTTSVPFEVKELARAIESINEKQARDFAAMQKLERVRSEFLANVSHELRTPIFAVQGFLETLLDGAIDDPEVNRDFIERAQSQAQRLNSLLNDLIDISRIESGEMRMSFRLFEIVPFLQHVIFELKALAVDKETTLLLTVPPIHELLVFGDKERLKQVLVNLIENAVKYSPPNSEVEVRLELAKDSDEFVSLSVLDNGIGIAPEHLPRIFERFYRVDKDRSRSAPGGTGLGLAIVKHIVEAHKSRIIVESESGKGTTFRFLLHRTPFL